MKRVLGVVALAGALLLSGCGEPYVEGVLIDKQFIPSATGVGSGVSADGKVVTTVTTTDECWLWLIATASGDTSDRCVTERIWASAEEGDQVAVGKKPVTS